jgi:membrane protease YdiL (CAAX protease family)
VAFAGAASYRASLPYRVAWVFYLVVAAIAVVWIGAREGGIPLTLFVEPGSLIPDLLLGLLAAAALIGAWEVAMRVLPAARRLLWSLRRSLGPLRRQETIALAVISGFSEELFVRGAIQGAIGWLPAAVLFALFHKVPGERYGLWAGFALVAGLLFGALVVWRGALLAAIVAHVVVNAVGLERLLRLDPSSPELEN